MSWNKEVARAILEQNRAAKNKAQDIQIETTIGPKVDKVEQEPVSKPDSAAIASTINLANGGWSADASRAALKQSAEDRERTVQSIASLNEQLASPGTFAALNTSVRAPKFNLPKLNVSMAGGSPLDAMSESVEKAKKYVNETVDPYLVAQGEETRKAFYDYLKRRVGEGKIISTEDLPTTYPIRGSEDPSNPEMQISFGETTIPMDIVRGLVADYNNEILHQRQFKEDAQYRNDWFLKHAGITEKEYRNRMADHLEGRLKELKQHAHQFNTKQAEGTTGLGTYGINARSLGHKQINTGEIKNALDLVEMLRKDDFSSGWVAGSDANSLFTLGILPIANSVETIAALNKANKGEKLTDSEKVAVETWEIQQEANELIETLGGRSLSSSIGEGAAASSEFIVQMLATSGYGSGVKVATGLGRAAAAATLKRIATKGTSAFMKNALKEGAIKVANSVVVSAAKVPLMPMTYKTYTDKRMGQFSIGQAEKVDTGELETVINKAPQSAWRDAMHSGLETFMEIQSEDFGQMLDWGAKSLGAGIARNMFGRSVGLSKTAPGIRNQLLRFVRQEGKISSFGSEVLSEAYGDAMVNTLEGNDKGWRQMATQDYWWQLAGVSALLSGGFSVTESISNRLSNGDLRKSLKMAKQSRDKALSEVLDPELKKTLYSASRTDNLVERSRILGSIDWKNKKFDKTDVALTLDFLNAQTQLDVLSGSAKEVRRILAIQPYLDRIGALQYANSGEIKAIEVSGGKTYFAQKYNDANDTFTAIDVDGKSAEIPAGDVVRTLNYDISDVIAEYYANTFRVQEQQEQLQDILEASDDAKKAGFTDDQIMEMVRKTGLTVYNPGDRVELLNGEQVTINANDGLDYEVVDDAGNTRKVAFEEVLQDNSSVAEAQRSSASNDQTALDSRPEVQQARSEAREQAEAIKNLDDDLIYQASTLDGVPVSIVKGANIVFDDESGAIDYDASDSTVVVQDQSGTRSQISIRDLDSIDEVISVDEAASLAGEAVQVAMDTVEADVEAAAEQAAEQAPMQEDRKDDLMDKQGNPINTDGSLRVEVVESIDDITDEDFEAPFRNIRLPELPNNVSDAIGAGGRSVVIKKNIFEKNGEDHVELSPEDNRNILRSALYSTNLVGSTQPIKRPDYKVAIQTGDMNSVVVLDVYRQKEYIEVVGWRMVNQRGLDKMKRQAEREGGQFLILSPIDGSAAALSALPLGRSSDNKNTTFEPKNQEDAKKNVAAPEIPTLKNGQPDYNAMSEEMFVEQYVTRFGEKNTENIARNNIKSADKAITDLGKKIGALTDPNKLPELQAKLDVELARKARYVAILDLLGLSENAQESNSERVSRLKKENTDRIAQLFPDGLPNAESVILADIAGGHKMRWSDKVVNGAVVSRGLGAELGLADSNAERNRRVGLLSNDAPTPDEYAGHLRELLDAMGIRYEESELRDKVIDTYASVDTRGNAWKALESLAANQQAQEEALDYEEEQMRRAYEREQQKVQNTPDQRVDVSTEDAGHIGDEQMSTEDEVPFRVREYRSPLHDRVAEWENKLGIAVNVMESIDEVENKSAREAIQSGKRVTGWFEPSTGEVMIYIPFVRNIGEIDKTIIHEIVAHKGLRQLLGEEKFGSLMDRVWNMMSEQDQSKYIAYPGVNGDTRKAADEYMAFLAEGVDLTEQDKNVWQKVVDFFREILAGLGVDIQLSDADLEELIRASYQNLVRENRESVDEDTRFRFIGEKGAANLDKAEEATTRLDNLAVARQMDTSGKDAKTIKMATGWERGADQKWRYEENDIKMVSPEKWVPHFYGSIALEEVMEDSNGLFDAYPELRSIKIKRDKRKSVRGSYNVGKKIIQLNLDNIMDAIAVLYNPSAYRITKEAAQELYTSAASTLHGTLIHELQHAIQYIEGFALGADPKMAADAEKANELNKRLQATNDKAVEYNALSPEERRTDFGRELRDSILRERKTIKRLMKQQQLGSDGYKRVAGEVEARNVSARRNLSMAERLASLAEETEDVARKDQIFIFDALAGEGEARFRVAKKETAPETESSQDENQPSVVSSADGAKILQNIDYTIKKYEENGIKRTNTFLGDIAKAINARKRGSNSRYATFEAMNGRVFTIRLSDHNATVSNFDKHNERDGISIVITSKKKKDSEKITNDGNAHIVEYYYNAIKLRKAAGQPLVEILKSIKQALHSGEYKDTTGLAVREEVNVRDGVSFRVAPTITYNNFFDHTEAIFAQTDRPNRPADYTSYKKGEGAFRMGKQGEIEGIISSEYWYGSDEGGDYIIRGSDHWTDVSGSVNRILDLRDYYYRDQQKPAWAVRKYGYVGRRFISTCDWSIVVNNTPIDGSDGKLYGKVYLSDMSKRGVNTTDPLDNPRFRVAPTFYSNAANAVLGIKQEKATPEQWLKMIEKNGGLKSGEDKWIGLSDWLKASGKKTLTKQEVLDYINENQIQIEETTYSSNSAVETTPEFKALQEEFNQLVKDYENEAQRNLDEYEAKLTKKYNFTDVFDTTVLNKDESKAHISLSRAIDEAYNAAWVDFVDRYGDDFEIAFWRGHDRIRVDNAEAASILLGLPIDRPIYHLREDYTTKGLEGNREIALTVPTIESWNEYDETHFGDAGEGRTVAWVRFGETTDADGKRVLVIDEIQSKRHQEGRERGYKPSYEKQLKVKEDEYANAKERYENVVQTHNSINDSLLQRYGIGFSGITEAEMQELQASYEDMLLARESMQIRREELVRISNGERGGGVPEAPFDKNWAELAMKRMLRYAAEHGYDKIAWTTGNQQAERYAIGSIVDRIESVDTVDYDSVLGVDLIKQVTLFPRDHSSAITLRLTPEGIVRASSMYNGEHIANIVGKEIGGRIMSDNNLILKGQDLRIGGEGMRAFYDQMLPSFMRKYGKKWGVKVQDVTLPNVEEAGRTMHSVDVTDSMRESVMQGQPMFRVAESNAERAEIGRNAYDDAFAEVAAEYEALDKSDEGAMAAWRAKKRNVVQSHMQHITDMLGLPCEVFVINPYDESTIKEAHRRYIEARDRFAFMYRDGMRVLNEIEKNYNEFAKEIAGLSGAYAPQSNIAFYNIAPGVIEDKTNNPNVWRAILVHENTHRVIEMLGIDQSALAELWDVARASFPKSCERIEEAYKKETQAAKGEEFLAYAVESRVTSEHAEVFFGFLSGNNSISEVMASYKNSVSLVRKYTEDILNELRNGKIQRTNAERSTAGAQRGTESREVLGFRGRPVFANSRANGESNRGIVADDDIRFSIQGEVIDIDQVDIDQFSEKEKTELEKAEISANRAMKALRRFNKAIRSLSKQLQRANADDATIAKHIAGALDAQVKKEGLQNFFDLDRAIREIAAASTKGSAQASLDAITMRVAKARIAAREVDLAALMSVQTQKTNAMGVAIASNIDDTARTMVEFFRMYHRLDMEGFKGALERNAMGVHLLDQAELMDWYMQWHEVEDLKATIDEVKADIERLRNDSNGYYHPKKEADRLGKIEDSNVFLKMRAAVIKKRRNKERELLNDLQILATRLEDLCDLMARRIKIGRIVQTGKTKHSEDYRKEFLSRGIKDVKVGFVSSFEDGKTEEMLKREASLQEVRDLRMIQYFSLKYMVEAVSINAVAGRGFLYDALIEGDQGWIACRDRELNCGVADRQRVFEKAKELGFDSLNGLSAFFDTPLRDRGGEQVYVDYTTSRAGRLGKESVPMTIGYATYLLAMRQQPDIAPTLDKMNFEEDTILRIKSLLELERNGGGKAIVFLNFAVDTLEELRDQRYNPASIERYGTQLDNNENYFPVRRLGIDLNGKAVDMDAMADLYEGDTKVSARALIKRKRNYVTIDFRQNPLQLFMSHIEEMNHFAAFAPLSRNLEILLNSPGFKEQLNAQKGFGHGVNTYKRFQEAAILAVGRFNAPSNALNKAVTTLNGLVAASKISLRGFTALKQILSLPAGFAYNPSWQYKLIFLGNMFRGLFDLTSRLGKIAGDKFKYQTMWNFCYENIPTFRQRWDEKCAGNENLKAYKATTIARWVQKHAFTRKSVGILQSAGMFANALVDQYCCSIIAYSVYQFESGRLVKEGKSKADAHKLALRRAAIAFNESQQSSEDAFISPSQRFRDVFSVGVSLFANSNRGYGRKARIAQEYLWSEISSKNMRDRRRGFLEAQLIEQYNESYINELKAGNETIRNFNERLSEDQIYEKVKEKRKEFEDKAKMVAKDKISEARLRSAEEWLFYKVLLNFLWKTAPILATSIIMGDDDDLDKESLNSMPLDKVFSYLAISYFMNGVGGSTIESVVDGFGIGGNLTETELGKLSDSVIEIAEGVNAEEPYFDSQAFWATVSTLSSMSTGYDMNTFRNLYHGIAGIINDSSLNDEDILRILSSPKGLIEAATIPIEEGESEHDYIRRQAFMLRLADDDVDRIYNSYKDALSRDEQKYKRKLDRWSKNYIEMRNAKILGVPYEKSRTGVISVPTIEELEDRYKKMLFETRTTRAGNIRGDVNKLTPISKSSKTWIAEHEYYRKIATIYLLEKRLDQTLVDEDSYGEILKDIMEKKQQLVEEWFNR